jgi:hypothetical protein
LKTYGNPPYGVSLKDPENQMSDYLLELKLRAEHKASGKKGSPKFPPGLPVPKCGLADWLAMHAQSWESILLVPNRTHRKWLRAWRKQCTSLIEMDPLAFHGQKQAAPFPLVLGYRGDEDDYFVDCFSHLGDPA